MQRNWLTVSTRSSLPIRTPVRGRCSSCVWTTMMFLAIKLKRITVTAHISRLPRARSQIQLLARSPATARLILSRAVWPHQSTTNSMFVPRTPQFNAHSKILQLATARNVLRLLPWLQPALTVTVPAEMLISRVVEHNARQQMRLQIANNSRFILPYPVSTVRVDALMTIVWTITSTVMMV